MGKKTYSYFWEFWRMYAKCLSVKELPPPFASGGLWRMWCLVSFAGIRHHPPNGFGGAKYSIVKGLTNIRHFVRV
jgi:hypothetical protein